MEARACLCAGAGVPETLREAADRAASYWSLTEAAAAVYWAWAEERRDS